MGCGCANRRIWLKARARWILFWPARMFNRLTGKYPGAQA